MPALILAISLTGLFQIPRAFGTVTATVSTDKADYGATEVVTITGSGFEAEKTYTLEVISTDNPMSVYTASVTTDSLGAFVHKYQLDGLYRPNYTVYVKDGAVVVATTTFTDKPAINLDQCANGGVSDPPVQCNGAAWQNGNLGQSQAHYLEGQFVPYRTVVTGLTAGATYNVTIEWDTTKSGKHALDYIGTYNATESTGNDPCSGVAECFLGTSTATSIPPDPNVTNGQNQLPGDGDDIVQTPGDFTIFNGTNASTGSSYTVSGTYAGDSSTSITLTFESTVNGSAVIAWSGHIATRADWGAGNSAISITGSPYHMRLTDFDCSNVDNCGVGQQDRSLSAEAVIFPASITIVKDALPNDAQDFAFTTTGSGLSSFSLDDDSDSTLSSTKVFPSVTTFGTKTVTEGSVTGWALTGLSCSEDGTVNSSTNLESRTATLVVEEGENLSCTFTNTLQQAHLTLVKTVTNDNGGSAAVTDWTLAASGPTPISGTSGSGSVTNAAVNQGSYTLSESGGPANYTAGTYSCVKNDGAPVVSNSISLVANDVATCTVNNNDNAPALHLRKTVTNDNGGSAVNTDWTLTATGTGGSPTNLSGSTPVDSGATFKADTYTLGETGPANYTAGAWDCGAATMPDATHVTVPFGGDVTCTINNNDNAPSLTLVKVVTNDNGGTAVESDWTLTATGPTGFSGAGPSVSNGASFDAGSYDLSESGPAGYSASAWVCVGGTQDDSDTVTLGLGQSATCTITNNDNAPSLTLVKEVTNDDGGISTAAGWTLTATGPTGFSGAGPSVSNGASFDAGTYDLSEAGPAGYSASAWVCVGSTQDDGNTVTLGLGQSAICTITNDDNAPTLKLVKTVTNDNGGSAVEDDWTLNAEAEAPNDGRNFSNLGGSGAFETVFANADYDLFESGPSGYTAGSWDCDGGTLVGNIVTLALDEDVTCTVDNNDQAAHLTLLKTVVNNNGGTAVDTDWTLTAAGPTPLSGVEGDAGVTNAAVNAGAYTLGETGGPSGYSASAYSCVKNGGAPVVSNSITLALDDSATCTITNDDIQPQLIVIKHVINDNGGSAAAGDFGMIVTATNATPNLFVGEESPGTTVGLDAGSYTIGETGPSGYAASFSADCSGSIAVGETKTCTVTNDDQAAHLIVIKHVVNDNGGAALASDFTLDSGGDSDTPDNFAGAEAPGVDVTLDAGSYNVTESGPAGYAASFSANCSGTIANGETKTCTVTNDDIAPQLVVIKHVINDNGGSAVAADFTLDSGGTNDSPDNFTGAEAPGTTVTLNAGAYNVTESGLSGYIASFSADCSGTIAVGEIKTCTVTNDDQQAFITVVKVVNNDNGGVADPDDFSLTLEGGAILSGVAAPVNPGTYTAEETLLTGYAFEGYSGDCDSNGDVTVALGESKTCTLTNNDVQPKLTLVKHVTNDNGGDAVVGDFPLFVDATPVTSGAENGFNAGSYTASETTQPGYTASVWSGDCAADGTVALAVGDDKTCEITNDDNAPSLTLVKVVVNDNGGTASESDWNLTADGPTGFTGAGPSVSNGTSFDAGSYDLSEVGPAGYAASDWVCVGGIQDDGDTVTLGLGESATCTITNDDNAPVLHLRKLVVNDNGGTALATAWTLNADGAGSNDLSGSTPVDSGADLLADTFALSETGPTGYSASDWVCAGDGEQNGANITLGLGEEATCTITNNDIAPQLIVIKHVINNSGGSAVAGDFTMNVTATNPSDDSFPGEEAPGTTITLDVGAYSVDESAFAGYTKTLSADCSGTIALGETKTCTITNDDNTPITRTLGFWQTHFAFTSSVYDDNVGDPIWQICTVTRNISSKAILFGGFYASVPKTTSGAKRTPLNQARMQLMQQLLAVILNHLAFGSGSMTMINTAKASYCGTDRNAILAQAAILDTFNNAGDSQPAGTDTGKADPKSSKGLADPISWNTLP